MKKFFAILLSLSMLICFAACGNDEKKDEKKDDEISEETSTDEKGETASENESYESDSDVAQSTDSDESTSTSADISVSPAENDFDVLRGNNFYMSGSMTDEAGDAYPAEMAITPEATYMLATNEGITLGMLLHKDYICMILGEQKAYLKIPSTMMETMGMSAEDMGMEELNFSELPELSEASEVTEEEYNGYNCSVYHFDVADGTKTLVYLEGEKLISLVKLTSDGDIISTWNVDVITTEVPAEKITPPADYKCYEGLPGMMEFMTEFEDIIGGAM